MSRQEFEPQQYTDSVQDHIQESEARPYYWSTRPNTGNVPKNEHPANFEDSMSSLPPVPPYSYAAQNRVTQQSYTSSSQARGQQARGGLSPDGDAMEHGYRPYNSYNRPVPPWARPQRGKGIGRVVFFVVLGLMLLKPLLLLLTGLLVLAGVVLLGVFIAGVFALVSMFIVFVMMGRRPPLGLFRPGRYGRRRW